MKINRRFSRQAISLGLAAMMAVGATVPAFAAGETSVTVTGGSLGTGGISWANFGGVTLDGSAETTTASWDINDFADARGTGAGWNITLALTQFAEHDGTAYVTSGKTLATSSVTVTTAPIVSKVDATSSATNTITPVANSTALDTGSAVTLLSAAADGGMGSYSFSNMLVTMSVPANAYAKLYKSNATVTTNTGP